MFFDYLMGNRDNHLKTFSVLLDEDMRRATLPPVYDVLDTTVYGRPSMEVGVLLSFDRLVTDVACPDVTDAFRHTGYSEDLS